MHYSTCWNSRKTHFLSHSVFYFLVYSPSRTPFWVWNWHVTHIHVFSFLFFTNLTSNFFFHLLLLYQVLLKSFVPLKWKLFFKNDGYVTQNLEVLFWFYFFNISIWTIFINKIKIYRITWQIKIYRSIYWIPITMQKYIFLNTHIFFKLDIPYSVFKYFLYLYV